MNHRKIISILLTAAYVLIAGCAANQAAGDNHKAGQPPVKYLRVGVTTNAPPLIYQHEGKIVGLEADFARQFAQFLGKPVRFVELKWDRQIPTLLDNRIDIIMSGMTITEMRMVRIAFSDPYFRSGQMALIRIEDASRFQLGIRSIAQSKSIGVIKDTTGQFFVEKQLSHIKRVAFESSADAVMSLQKKRIDVFIHDAPIILNLAAKFEAGGLMAVNAMLTEEYLAWGIRKEDRALLQSANAFLQNLKDQKRLYPLVKRWIPLARTGRN